MPPQISCQHSSIVKAFNSIIPEQPRKEWLLSPNAFSRERKLPFRYLITFCLSHISSVDKTGTAISINQFIKKAQRSHLWPQASSIDKSCISRARAKLSWHSFDFILNNAVKIAYKLWENKPWHTWHGLSVFAIDGTKFRLPATDSIRDEFDYHDIHSYSSKGYYPQCQVSTVYDVFRRLPVARTIERENFSERESALSLLPSIPKGGVLLFDRGYPCYELIKEITEKYENGYFLMRCSTKSTFSEVDKFLKTSKQEERICIKPTSRYARKYHTFKAPHIELRAIRMKCADGSVSVLLTNLPKRRFEHKEIRDLYYRRWEIESYYRDEKETLQLEFFHTKSPNGIRQELLCAVIISVLSRVLMMVSDKNKNEERKEPQFKNAVITVNDDILILISGYTSRTRTILNEMVALIGRIKHYRPKNKRTSQPRITKRPTNRWIKDRGDMRLFYSKCNCKP